MLFECGAESIEKFLRPVIRTPTCLTQSAIEKTGCGFILALSLRRIRLHISRKLLTLLVSCKKTDSHIPGFNPYRIILALRLLVAEPGDLLDEYIDISSLLLNCGHAAFFLLVFLVWHSFPQSRWYVTDHGSLLLLREWLLGAGTVGIASP